jgi:hypothetical protein
VGKQRIGKTKNKVVGTLRFAHPTIWRNAR